MIKYKKAILGFSLLFLISGVWAQQKKMSLSLEDCILRALKENLGVAVEVLNPEIADMSVSQAGEKFLPQLSLGYNIENTESASYSWIESEGDVKTKYNDYSGRITQLIPTGGSFYINLFSYKNDTNRKLQTINPSYYSSLAFNFSQPLLKNFGFKINRREIIIAKNNLNKSENQLKSVLMDTIYNVEDAYWNLVYSIENLNAKRQSLELAQDLLKKNKKEVEIGTLAPMEILGAEAEVATREADILQAEAMVKNAEDRLKTIINLTSEGELKADIVIPTEKPSYEKIDVNLEEALHVAMKNRPDLQRTRMDIKNNEINLGYARNQLLPDLSFVARYWSPGLSGTHIEIDPNNPFGDPLRIIPGKSIDSLKDAFGFKYNNWTVGVTLSVPLNTVFSRAQCAIAKVTLEQTMLRLKNQEQQVFLELKNTVRAVQTDYKRVQAYRVARELAEKKLEAEEKKLKVGLTTNYLVLQYQRDLANSRSAELRAIIDYNLSLALLDKAMGISLDKKNIRLSEIIESTAQ